MFTIKVGGVPEHFNYPWIKCIENNLFKAAELDVKWKDCPGGTGEMSKYLKDGEIDLAIMLTEGSLKEIESGKDFKIIQIYIESPLLWGIHVDAQSNYKDIADLKGKTAAISRFNSGSHLMTHVLADQQNWDLNKLKFKVCNNLDGAITALENNEADYLLWERFTTKPYVDSGQLNHIGNCPTPWPCFVIVTRTKYYHNNQHQIDKLLEILNKQTSNLKTISDLSEKISQKYEIDNQDIKKWLSKTEWSISEIKTKTMNDLKHKLKKYSII